MTPRRFSAVLFVLVMLATLGDAQVSRAATTWILAWLGAL